jgi:selenocysteine lyase/cysteine desulfurase
MGVSRRTVIGVAAGALGATATGCEPEAAGPAPPLDPNNWDSVRAQFGLEPGLTHLASFVFASHPAAVQRAIEQHRAALDRNPIATLDQESTFDGAVGAAAARYLGTSADQLAFTDSTTMGLGLLYTGLRLDAGDEVLTTEHDFYATHEALRLRAQRDGVTVRRVKLYDDPAQATVDGIVNRLAEAVTARTAVVAVTWVHSSTGVRLPIRQISDALRDRRPLLCVDGVHGFGVEDATPAALGADFLVSGCHKWLYGPRGTGLIWASPEGWARFTPVIPPFDGRVIGAWMGFQTPSAPPGATATPGGYHSFEHRWALSAAFDFHRAIGRERITARTHQLAALLKEKLAGVPGVRLVTPVDPQLSAGIVCARVDGRTVAQLLARLRAAKVIASATPYNPSYLRFGTSIVNNEADVEAAVAALKG